MISFRSILPKLEFIKIPRWIDFVQTEGTTFELYAFCDASEQTYAISIYLRAIQANSSVNIHSLVSKTKVSTVKYSSLPHLELLLVRLRDRIKIGLNFEEIPMHGQILK